MGSRTGTSNHGFVRKFSCATRAWVGRVWSIAFIVRLLDKGLCSSLPIIVDISIDEINSIVYKIDMMKGGAVKRGDRTRCAETNRCDWERAARQVCRVLFGSIGVRKS